MKKFMGEFREFISRGNVMDMAVGVIIGGAFTAIVTSLTDNIITPLINLIAGGGADQISGLKVPGTEIDFGAFLGAVINFLIVAFIVFCLVKAINKAQALGEKIVGGGEAAAAEPEPAPVCPFCLEEHKPGAKVCPHCGSKLE